MARSLLGPLRGARVADVGGRPGQAARVFRGADVVAINVDEPADVVFDGVSLPFPDASFDAALSMDVLEHVEPAQRDRHVAELVRVSSGPVLVSAPLGTPEHRAIEEERQAWCTVHSGAPHPFLADHLRLGLPDVAEVERLARAFGLAAHFHGDAREAAETLQRTALLRRRPWLAVPLALRLARRFPDLRLSVAPGPFTNRVFLVSMLAG